MTTEIRREILPGETIKECADRLIAESGDPVYMHSWDDYTGMEEHRLSSAGSERILRFFGVPIPEPEPTPNPYAIRDGETLRECAARIIEESGDPMISFGRFAADDPKRLSDLYLEEILDYFDITPPTFDTPETVAALAREWLRRNAKEARIHCYDGALQMFTEEPQCEILIWFARGDDIGWMYSTLRIGWPLDLLNFLVAEVPWIRELHVKAGGK